MKMKTIFGFVFYLIVTQTIAQDQKITTFILLRHAERADAQNTMTANNDPDLSEEGKKRAERLMEMFSKTKIDAVYSTPFIRTKKTVEPLAQSKSLTVIEYDPKQLSAIDKMLQEHEGQTVVVCGHSNTIPKIANYLTNSGSYPDFDDKDYGNILIITVLQKKKSTTVTWLRY